MPAVETPPLDPVRERRRAARIAARSWLRSTWPQLFAGGTHVPLAIGISKTLFAHPRPASISRKAVGAAMKYHVQGRLYLKALACEGAMRHGADGAPVEPVSDTDRASACERYEKMYGPKEQHDGR
jgi:ProQ/FINO family